MNKKILNILIIILILLPFGVLVYFYGGFNKKQAVNQTTVSTQPCEQIPTVYFGIVKSNDHVTLSIEDNYLYTSLGANRQHELAFPQNYNYVN